MVGVLQEAETHYSSRAHGYIPDRKTANPSRGHGVTSGVLVGVAHLFSFLLCFCFVCLLSVFCSQWCLCIWIVHAQLPLLASLAFIT